jgi:hypothetical protein
MQSNGPHASKSEADGVEAERERQPCEWLCKYAGSAHTGAVWSRRISSCASRGVQSAMLWHCMYMSREDSVHEPENPEVRERNGIANQSGPIGFSHEFTASSSTFPSSIAEQVHNTSRKLVNPFIELFSSSILFIAENHFPSVLLHNQGYPKVCPDSLNLLNAGDSFVGYRRYLPVICFPGPGT